MHQYRQLSLILSVALFLFLWLLSGHYYVAAISMAFSLYVTIEFLDSLGSRINIPELAIFMLAMMYLVFPFLTYHLFNNDVGFGRMALPQEEYYPYVLGAIFFFRFGLKSYSEKNQIGYNVLSNIFANKQKNGHAGIILIVIGFAAFFLKSYIPLAFRNVFYLLEGMRFIGAFYLIFSNHHYKFWLIGIVFLHFTLRTIAGTLFYELFTWATFTVIFYLSTRPATSLKTKAVFFAIAWLGLFFIQIVKTEYRTVIRGSGIRATEAFRESAYRQVLGDEEVDLLNISNLEKFTARMNLGWVVTEIIDHVSTNDLYSRGATLLEDIPGIILPRFLYPKKRSVAGGDLRIRFEKFTGRVLTPGTTINLSAIGDAYINFGFIGGWFLLYMLGWLIRWLINKIKAISYTKHDIIIWMPLIFFDFVRMNDFYYLLNSVVKNTLLVLIVFYLFRNYFNRNDQIPVTEQENQQDRNVVV